MNTPELVEPGGLRSRGRGFMEILENDYNQFHEHLPEFISKKGVLRVENS